NHRPRLYKILLQIVSRRRYELSNRFPPAAQPQTAEDPIAALRALPEQFAQVVLLADVHEFTYEEIQETLGISAVTLTSRLSRGRDEFACALSWRPQVLNAATPVARWTRRVPRTAGGAVGYSRRSSRALFVRMLAASPIGRGSPGSLRSIRG